MAKTQKNKVRIIGGFLGSRTISFKEVDGLRPTLDRVRETLFNWIQAEVINASCIDLFAGSGALGFEAISRGAKNVTFVEKNKAVITKLSENTKTLGLSNIEIKQTSALNLISQEDTTFDIIFVDPPFAMKNLEALPFEIEKSGLMHETSLLYLECSSKQSYKIPDNWQILKTKKVGDVKFQLAQRQQ